MRWGIPNDAYEYHGTLSLCKKEITDCKEFSIGPNFVVKKPKEMISFNLFKYFLNMKYKKDASWSKIWSSAFDTEY